jgi:protein-ribulosamine 3-kinase
VELKDIRPVGGGCINHACRAMAGGEPFFLKWNDAHRYPGMFASEAQGLALLREAGALNLPAVLHAGTAGPYAYILMEWMEPGRRKPDFWKSFGAGLAQLHRNSQERFGLSHDNYIGSLPQHNRLHGTWTAFFMSERLEPQLKMAVDSGMLAASATKRLEALHRQLDEWIPKEAPALLHGDLWNGNFLTGPDGLACLVDPAVYFGHREMDLAMTKLFGGFDADFYAGYQEAWPLEKGFDRRMDIHNLYPLLVHVNLFGGGYVQQVERILTNF